MPTHSMPFVDTLERMGKRKDTPSDTVGAGGHKSKPFQLRMHRRLREQLDKLVERNASDITEEIRIAIRKHLESAGLWPPSDG